MGPSPLTKLTRASLSEKMIPLAVNSGNNSCKICRMRMTDFNIVVSPSNSASKEERYYVLPDVVALACTAPESRPRATMDPSIILRRRGPVVRDASVLLRIETGDVPPSTSGMFCVVYKYPKT